MLHIHIFVCICVCVYIYIYYLFIYSSVRQVAPPSSEGAFLRSGAGSGFGGNGKYYNVYVCMYI